MSDANEHPTSLPQALLVHAATGLALCDAALHADAARQREFDGLLAGGLGPLLLHTAGAARLPAAWRTPLAGADLTARVHQADRVQALHDLIGVCQAPSALPLVLLKGMSVCTQWYPASHLRPMSDLDVLIPATGYGTLERALLDAGWRRHDWPDGFRHQHGAPLQHPRLRVVVELHTALFLPDAPPGRGSTFDPARLIAESVPSNHDQPALRYLAAHTQLAYIAAAWFNDITHVGVHPALLAPAFDAAFLLRATHRTLDWDALLRTLDGNEMATASLHAMLTWLQRYSRTQTPPAVLAWLASHQTLVGPLQQRLIHHLLSHHLFGARPWRHALPPPVPARYSLQHQWRKRVLGRA